ncbi:MAG: hypothetical protein OXT09_01530, partial [Myxococcales bacterium]|nr:hypothetical protein [Myxococcales bacterium]
MAHPRPLATAAAQPAGDRLRRTATSASAIHPSGAQLPTPPRPATRQPPSSPESPFFSSPPASRPAAPAAIRTGGSW